MNALLKFFCFLAFPLFLSGCTTVTQRTLAVEQECSSSNQGSLSDQQFQTVFGGNWKEAKEKTCAMTQKEMDGTKVESKAEILNPAILFHYNNSPHPTSLR